MVIALSSVHGQMQKFVGKTCSIDSQQLYDRSLLGEGIDTCYDYCRSSYVKWHKGRCELNNGYGECNCLFCVIGPGKPVVSTLRCE